MLAFLPPFYLSVVRSLQAHLDEVRANVVRQLRNEAQVDKTGDSGQRGPDEQLAEYYRYFPPVRSAPQWLEKLIGLAESCGLSIDQGEYHASQDGD